MVRGCEHDGCEAALPTAGRGRIPRYCSNRCRTAAHRARRREQPAALPVVPADPIPAELRTVDRWVRRSPRKVPLTAGGAAASSTLAATWTTYRRACRSTAGVGLGFVLAATDDIVCIDLDHCLTPDGTPLPWAAEILDRAPATWVERSPGGDGLHLWGRARFSGGRKLRRGGQVEIYGDRRFIAVTGDTFGGAPAALADITDLISSLI